MESYLSFKEVHLRIEASILTVGMLGHSLSFLVISRKKFSKTSIAFYLRAMAIVESYIIFTLIDDIYYIIYDQELNINSQIFCKVFFGYSTVIFTLISTWILTLFAVEKTLDTKNYQNPRLDKWKKLMKTRKFKVVSMLILVILSLIQFLEDPILIEIKPVIAKNNTPTGQLICDPFDVPTVWLYIGTATYGIEGLTVPMVILTMTTYILIRSLFKSRKELAKSGKVSSRRQQRDRKYAITSIVLNVLFIIFKLPIISSAILNKITEIDEYFQKYYFDISNTIFLTYSSMTFFVHFATNSLFRHELLHIFRDLVGSIIFGTNSSGVVQSGVVLKAKNVVTERKQQQNSSTANSNRGSTT